MIFKAKSQPLSSKTITFVKSLRFFFFFFLPGLSPGGLELARPLLEAQKWWFCLRGVEIWPWKSLKIKEFLRKNNDFDENQWKTLCFSSFFIDFEAQISTPLKQNHHFCEIPPFFFLFFFLPGLSPGGWSWLGLSWRPENDGFAWEGLRFGFENHWKSKNSLGKTLILMPKSQPLWSKTITFVKSLRFLFFCFFSSWPLSGGGAGLAQSLYGWGFPYGEAQPWIGRAKSLQPRASRGRLRRIGPCRECRVVDSISKIMSVFISSHCHVTQKQIWSSWPRRLIFPLFFEKKWKLCVTSCVGECQGSLSA